MKKNTDISTEKVVKKYHPKKDKSMTVITIVIAGFFIGSMWCVAYYPYTVISFYDFSKIFAFLAVIGFLLPLRLYTKWFHFTKYEAFIFNLMGIAPFICGSLLLINYYFYTTKFTHYYYIEEYFLEEQRTIGTLGIKAERNLITGKYKIKELTYPNEDDFLQQNYFYEIEVREGILGFKTVNRDLNVALPAEH
ncbi:MAG: hypothetical protein OQJ96_09245 [Flavobacteriales bacterium]|nr:hypothetical protein [Flavobacteriales bacterium]MCW8912131.1 hypothetical protein [Flavobacteriales bacterium]MCW8936771.1 hypothetical protein [Flavobacteriales bacterium]MCW8968419.1 hypothetical protein [Flavobacteriales bacterium]MCW8989722.1 hypothetical protein [Flavobacteriales bacterium]